MNWKNAVLVGALVGFVVGVVFILIQPMFGMSPLTDRHAAEYVERSGMAASTASVIAWAAHLLVSVAYGIATGIALLISRNLLVFVLQLLVLGWVTTVVAGPANELIIRMVSGTGSQPSAGLPPLNFNLDAKLALHLIFFFAIGALMLLYRRIKTR